MAFYFLNLSYYRCSETLPPDIWAICLKLSLVFIPAGGIDSMFCLICLSSEGPRLGGACDFFDVCGLSLFESSRALTGPDNVEAGSGKPWVFPFITDLLWLPSFLSLARCLWCPDPGVTYDSLFYCANTVELPRLWTFGHGALPTSGFDPIDIVSKVLSNCLLSSACPEPIINVSAPCDSRWFDSALSSLMQGSKILQSLSYPSFGIAFEQLILTTSLFFVYGFSSRKI